MEQFAQKLITTTTLGEQISIGEYNGHNTNAKTGEYKVYEITNEGDIYAILFVHVDETQDVNELLKTLDIEVNCGVDGGTYGIITAPEKLSYDNWMKYYTPSKSSYDNWTTYYDDKVEQADGFVTSTNFGDGVFTVYTNTEHSAFLLDDEEIYLKSLVAVHGQAYDDMDLIDGYAFDEHDVTVGHYEHVSRDEYRLIETKKSVTAGKRKIDAIVDLLISVA